MTHNYHHQIDRIIKANKIYRFEAELDDINNNPDNNPDNQKNSDSNTELNPRIALLNKLIIQYNSFKDDKQINEDKLKAHLKVLKDSQYQKKWQILTHEQRLNRFDEFIERKEITDIKIINSLKEAIKLNQLKTKDVLYDKLKCHIEKIAVLTINDNTKECKLDYAKIKQKTESIDDNDDNSDSDTHEKNNHVSKASKSKDTSKSKDKKVTKKHIDQNKDDDTKLPDNKSINKQVDKQVVKQVVKPKKKSSDTLKTVKKIK